MYEIAEKFIVNLASDLKMEFSEKEIHDLLDERSLDSTLNLPFHYDLKKYMPVDLWKRIITHSRWKVLGQLGLRIVSIGTSEFYKTVDCLLNGLSSLVQSNKHQNAMKILTLQKDTFSTTTSFCIRCLKVRSSQGGNISRHYQRNCTHATPNVAI